jgi:hypothetical protein
VLGDEHEDDFLAEWLANKQVKQSTLVRRFLSSKA